jgi:antitoxin component of MazEF toxin-antitoxin module
MTVAIAKWGNSVGVRLPSSTLKTAGYAIGDRFHAELMADRAIILRPVLPTRKRVDIFAMIESITPDTLPNFTELDAVPVGREVW